MTLPIHTWLEQGTLMSINPKEVLLGWGKWRWQTHPSTDGTPTFYFPDYFLENTTPWLKMEHTVTLSIDTLLSSLNSLSNDVPREKFDWKPPCKIAMEETFSSLQKTFQQTPLEKLVLYDFSKSNTSSLNLSHRLQTLRSMFSTMNRFPLYAYGFWNEKEGIIGATPEILFMKNQKKIETMALAGTVPAGTSPEGLLCDNKLKKEHQLVVNDLVARLSPFGQTKIGPLSILHLPTLSHLKTAIETELTNDENVETIIRNLHPTPALGGYPKELGLKWLIDYNQRLPRGRFGAPVGVVAQSEKSAIFYVAIRNVAWDSYGLQIGAGCGIIAESDCETEWEEMLLKMKSVRNLLQL